MAFASLTRPPDNETLKDIILDRIRRAGKIPFSEFMELALYHPEHGYYLACDPSLDYQSSPNVHAVFGAAVGRGLAGIWQVMDRPPRFDVLEAGAGNGRLAASALAWLRDQEPDCFEALRYTMQDVSYSRRDPLVELARAGFGGDRVKVTSEFPAAGSIDGVILSNELLDALPFERVRVGEGRLIEVSVGAEGPELVDVEHDASGPIQAYFTTLGLMPGEGCDAEAGLAVEAWVMRAANALKRGYLVTLDYGYEAAQLYAPWRRDGTLLTFYRHTSGVDPYGRVGLQDITASVDLSSLVQAGERAGLQALAQTTQTDYLTRLGIGDSLSKPDGANLQGHMALRHAVMELTDPAGLGRIRVLIQGKGVTQTLPMGFADGPAGIQSF